MQLRHLLPAATALPLLIATAPAAAAPIAPGKVIVRYVPGATRAEKIAVLHATGTATSAMLPGGTRALSVADGDSVAGTLAELRRHPTVASAVPDYVAHAAEFVPNDPGKTTVPGGWQQLQWNFIGPASVNAPAAWSIARTDGAPGGRGVIVAVIDSGVAFENYKQFRRAPDLYASRFVPGYDWIDRDRHPDDEESHGTHVTGTIAQKTNNAFGLTGLAYGVEIMPLRVLDSNGNGDGSNIARAIRWAVRHGARVINMSVEFDTSLKAGDIPEVISAIHYAHTKGAVMVAASGNEGVGKIAYPARDSDVISVGATTADACLADYSNAGRGLDIVAPGGGADAPLSADPYDSAHCDPTRPDRRIYQETIWGSPRHFRLVGFEGTSFATPHVSAAAALLLATKRLGAHPTPAAVKARLMATARDLGPPGYDSHYGAGLLDIAAALGP